MWGSPVQQGKTVKPNAQTGKLQIAADIPPATIKTSHVKME